MGLKSSFLFFWFHLTGFRAVDSPSHRSLFAEPLSAQKCASAKMQ